MNALLFACAFAMSAVALAFVLLPLRMRAVYRTPKFLFPAVATVFLCGIVVYAAIGNPGVVNSAAVPAKTAEETNAPANGEKLASVDQLLAGLEDRLEKNPDDGKGWLLLAQSYDHMGRKDDSIAAYRRAANLGTENAELAARIGIGTKAISYPPDSTEIDDLNALVN